MKKSSGFTILELMMVVVVVGVLAAVALPMYNESVRKSRRTGMKAQLQEIQQDMERYFTLNNTYDGFVLNAFGTYPNGSSGDKVFYDISFRNPPTATEWILMAEPANAHSNDRCGRYTLNQAGQKTAGESDCW